MNLLAQTFKLLTTPPGNLVYHLVVLFSLSTALWLSWAHWREHRFPQGRRAVGGLTFLLLAQVGLFSISALGWQDVFNLPVFLPPLERALTLLLLLWIAWLWLFPEPSAGGDALTMVASILVAAGGMLGLANWGEQAATLAYKNYNATFQAMLWGWATLGWLALAILLILIRRPNGWGYGLAFLFLAFLGELLTLLLEKEGNYPGGVRLTWLAAAPFLLTLSSRFPTTSAAPKPTPSAAATSSVQSQVPFVERRRYSADPKTVHALLDLTTETHGGRLNTLIARAVAQTMLADLCFVIYLTEDNRQLVFAGGYDLIREEPIEGASVPRENIPMLVSALQRGRPLRLPASSTSADVRGLAQLIGLDQPGHLLMTPILNNEKESLGGLLLLSPYSNRLWSAEDQSFLSAIANALAQLLQHRKQLATLEEAQEQARQWQERARELEAARQQAEEQLQSLKATAETAQAQEVQAQRRAQELAQLLSEAQHALQELRLENEQIRLQLERRGTSEEVHQVEKELRTALAEVARLQNQLAESNMRILELEKELERGVPAQRFQEQAEVIAAIAQELRQPLSSIIGYTDLLLGESVGILGAMQRKFVERIKASIERIRSLVDDLIRLTLIEGGLAKLNPEPLDLNEMIDAAMSYTSGQMREKNITLHLDLPKENPPIFADRDALQQILIHLLQNATLASPVEGEVRLSVKMKEESGQEFILLQVSDSGGGIAEEDLPRVFTRLYRAENVLIQGVGDTGVGLSLAKTLTEANGGRIWVDSKPGVGATFSVLLPIARL